MCSGSLLQKQKKGFERKETVLGRHRSEEKKDVFQKDFFFINVGKKKKN